jgi:hypothetical protein
LEGVRVANVLQARGALRGAARESGARNLLVRVMSSNVAIAVYTLLGIAVVLLIFLGALAFVDAARKGNRQFKWGSRPADRPPDEA